MRSISGLWNVATARTVALSAALICLAFDAGAIEASNRYRSPRNPERKIRPSTELIILHTTEAPARSSLNKLSDRGEAHFCVTEEGSIYRIVDRDREAFHAGRSMWRGKEDVDKFSIGIECVGYHDKPMSSVQLAAIRSLVKELQAMYRLSDDRVICHSHVAYGAPNKWQRHRHRGRKRCGMLFAMPSVRRELGLKAKPAFDPDTKARRLTVGDKYLSNVLYGSVDTMIGRCGRVPAVPAPAGGKPKGVFTRWFSKTKTAPPAAKATPLKKKPPPAVSKSPSVAPPKSVSELKAQGFVMKGSISKNNSALKIAGAKWNSADTYYTIRGKVIPGNKIDERRMEKGMGVWRKK
jgi:hypothetical protein